MKILYSALLALLLAEQASGFVPMQATYQRQTLPATPLGMAEKVTENSDVSIPYDEAARLAYDAWRSQYNKGDFDAKRFESFKANYETITVANVVAKKNAREDGTVSLSLMTLNEFGDLSQEEYKEAMQKETAAPTAPTTSTGDVLSKALEAAMLQSEASSALGEASDALAEEEQKLVEMLGLSSVEELEDALDSLEGIDSDGGELEPPNLAREARVREAYLNWCKEFGKETDESRFPTFSNNFLIMEQYAKESLKEMVLNQFADYSKEEYEAMQSGGDASASTATPAAVPEPVPAPPVKASVPAPVSAPPVKKEKGMSFLEKAAASIKAMQAGSKPKPAAAAPVSPPKESKPKPVVAAAAPAPAPVKKESKPEPAVAAAAPAPAPVKKEESSEDEETLLNQAAKIAVEAAEFAAANMEASLKNMEKVTLQTTEEREARMKVIAEATVAAEKRATEEREKRAKEVAGRATQEAKRRKEIDQEKADREKALSAAAQKLQAQTEAVAIAAARAESEREATRAAQRGFFDAQAAELAREKARAWEAQQLQLKKKVPPTAKKSAPAPKKAAPVVARKPVPSPVVKKTPAFSFFASPPAKATPVAKKPAPTPKPVAPVVAPVPAPVAKNSFSFFPSTPGKATLIESSVAKKPAKKAAMKKAPSPVAKKTPAPKPMKKAAPVVAPTPTPVAKKTPSFSFFSSPPAPEVKAAPAPAPAPVAKKTPSFSFFSTPPAPEVKAAPAPAPAPAAKPFSFFGSAPVLPKAAVKTAPKIPNRMGTISIPKSGTINIAKATGVKPKPKEVKPSASFSLFASKNVAPEPKAKPEAGKRSPTFSLFGPPPPKKEAPVAKKPAVKVPNRSGTIAIPRSRSGTIAIPKSKAPAPKTDKPKFSFFGSSSSGAPAGVPVLSQWKQNANGSITGKVSNSQGFQAGTEITTSPVSKGAKAGSLVKTGSGSQYYLS